MRTSLGWILLAWMTACGSDRPQTSPYAGMSSASVPSLTAQEVDDLLAGRGLGMARAAELNGYPGPRHVLDLRSELGLDQATVEGAEQLFEEMKSEAQPLGAHVVALEKSLGEAFASQSVDESALSERVGALAELMGQLRGVHLRAHIRMKELLTPEQVARYQELRGYPASSSAGSRAATAAHNHAR
ncbi:MAG TPA: hypothetical protein VJV78_17630 [Polyangiales bacterium]|nr:hypothetical protein [Polyangiales bacterium]